MNGQKRKNTLPPFLYGETTAFFDTAVQAVMEPMRTIPANLPEKMRLSALAFPVRALAMTEAMATAGKPEEAEQFALCFEKEPQFVADLLAAVTRFHLVPENEQRLSRKVAECADTRISNAQELRRLLVQGKSAAGFTLFNRLPSWDEVAKRLDTGAYKGAIDGERIRKKEYFLERKRRAQILKKWQPNIDAFWELVHSRLAD